VERGSSLLLWVRRGPGGLVSWWAAGPDECTDTAGWVLQAVALECWIEVGEAGGQSKAQRTASHRSRVGCVLCFCVFCESDCGR
jgi:hypothetical protein